MGWAAGPRGRVLDWAGLAGLSAGVAWAGFWVELVGSLGVGLGVWAPFLISFLFYFFSFLNLNQTKFEFKFKFDFKPHSNH